MASTPFIANYLIYADDDVDDKQLLSQSLSIYFPDTELVTVSSGDELLKFLGEKQTSKGLPCLIVIDQNMPGLTGDQTLSLLKQNEWYKEIPVVLFSTSGYYSDLLKKYAVALETKPSSYQDWEEISLGLMKHCERYRNAQ